MNIELLKEFFLWCLIVNYGVLLIWFTVFMFGRTWLFRLHSRWFKLSPEAFDQIHYAAIAFYKLTVLVFNLAPWIALSVIVRHG